ncbi:MAG TPA: response regulator, partial [Gemmataceae bacterium]|nr:response regulator [Gemmataceae bacterium]
RRRRGATMSAKGVRVLLVEGNAGMVHLMRLALREVGPEFELTWAGGLTAALGLTARERFDVILLDPALADTRPAEAVRQLRQAAPDVPLLLLASAADVGVCLGAMEQGAHDYLFKDVLTTHLLTRMIRDAVERSRPSAGGGAHLIDPVTGLTNLEGFLEQAAHLWRSPARLRKGATLLYLTLDGVPVSAADRALAETADVLRDTFRGSDLRGRAADADFVVLAVGAPETTKSILTGRLEEALLGCNTQDGRDYYLALRAGASHYAPERPRTVEDLLTAARARVGEERLGRRPPSQAARAAVAS